MGKGRGIGAEPFLPLLLIEVIDIYENNVNMVRPKWIKQSSKSNNNAI